MNGSVRSDRQGSLALVTLSHPGKFNAMTRSMWRELRRVFEDVQRDPALRCVLVRGAGGHFCAGGDIAEYPDFRFSEAGLRDFHENDVWGGLQAMLDCDLPIVAQIEGNCMGAGVEIACCCDIRIAEQSARFGAPIAKLGFPMAPREAALVMREAGALTTREMLLEATVFSAAQMLGRGFLNRVLPEGQAANEADAAVARIMSLSPQAARLNKQTIRSLCQSVCLDPSTDLATASREALLSRAYAYADSAQHREGVNAFLEKRKADY
jgi:enoyl-CoA hydratase/carnithine racemase